jgi:hypothetical protein
MCAWIAFSISALAASHILSSFLQRSMSRFWTFAVRARNFLV